jgi:hypothetical protein
MTAFPKTQEEFNFQIEKAMIKDFGYQPTEEEKSAWLDGLLNLANQILANQMKETAK